MGFDPNSEWVRRAYEKGLITGPPPLPDAGWPGPAPDASEEQFQAAVIKAATARGWKHYHTHDSRKSVGGFPDLVLVRDRVVYAELKSATGRVTDAQEEWLGVLRRAGQEVYVLRPEDWELVLRILR